MKKSKLLSLVALASLGLNANATDELSTEVTYYVQNVESGLFMSGVNNWGTRSTVSTQADLFKLVSNDGGYKLEDISLNCSDKWLGSNLFVDNGGVVWTVEPTGDAGVFTIYNSAAGGYLAQSATAGLSIGYETECLESVTNAAKWRFLTEEEATATLNGASADNPVSASFLIRNANFSRNHTQEWTVNASNKNMKGGPDSGNQCAEHWRSTFTVTQTLAVPNGKYKLTCQAAITDYANLNDGANYPVVFASNGPEEVSRIFLDMDASDRDKGLSVINPSFAAGKYLVETDEIIVTNGQLTIGAKGTRLDTWCAYDNFNLTYLGKVTDLSAYKDGFDKAVAAANGVDQNAKMNASVLSALQSAISTYNVDFSTFTSADDISTAVTALSNAANAATASIANYAAVTAKLNTLDAAGKAVFLATEVAQKYANNTYTDEDCTSAFATAAKAQTTAGADMTLAIANPNIYSYSGENTKFPGGGWDEANSSHSGWSWTKGTGDTYMENWNANAADSKFDFNQTITGLPNGTYKVSADMFNTQNTAGADYAATNGVYGKSANESIAFIDVDGDVFNTYTTGEVYVVDGTLTIGVKTVGTSTTGWFGADNFKLTYVSNTYPSEYNPVEVAAEKLAQAVSAAKEFVGKKMNASVASELSTAIANGEKSYTTVDEYAAVAEAVNTAKSAAEASVKVYEQIAAINAKAAALGAVGEASYASTLAAYNAGTLTTVAEAETAYAEAYAAYNEAAYKAVTSKGTDMTSVITNPSFETGDLTGWTCTNEEDTKAADNSNGTYTMSGCDGAKVFNTWKANSAACAPISQTITGLKAGRYAIVATMASDAAHELYVSLNDGTKGTATTTDKGTGVVVSAEGEIAVGSEELTIEAGTTDGGWFKADNFKLVLLEEYAAPVIADLTVKDGVAVAESQDAKNITYVREFKAANKWQSLYLPFSVNLENNEADVVLAKVDDVVEDNGELVINIVKVSTTETVEACKPLFIAAKSVGVKNIKTGVSTVASPNDGGNDYSAAEFTGILSEARAGQAGRYVMSGGELCLVPQSMNNLTLGVNRWAMIVNGGNGVRIRINAEGFDSDEATAIANAVAESVENGEIFSINGAKVKDAKSGLYIKGGKKVLVK